MRTLYEDEWSILRKIRLRALRESPDWFLSDYDREARWGEQEWRHAVADAEWFVAFCAGEPIGLAGVVQVLDTDVEPHVISMWVDPDYRRTGIARKLLDDVMRTMTGIVYAGIQLWVIKENHEAQKAYGQMGFDPTGEEQPLPDGSGRVEVRMRCSKTDWCALTAASPAFLDASVAAG